MYYHFTIKNLYEKLSLLYNRNNLNNQIYLNYYKIIMLKINLNADYNIFELLFELKNFYKFHHKII